jgi:hypothetical protein
MAGAVCARLRMEASGRGPRRNIQCRTVQCARHGLATGPDGLCALCHRDERAIERTIARGHDPARRIAVVLVAIMAAVATFFLVGALLDTR